MKVKETIWRVVGITGVSALLLSMISFIDKREVGYRVDDIEVDIENTYENFFIDEEDVMSLILENKGDTVLGDAYGRVSLKEIERRVESHSFVKDAQVFRDLNGHLVVKATQNKPIARIIADNGKQAYLGEEGDILPVSSKYTARVLVLSGSYMDGLTAKESIEGNEYDQKLYDLIEYISEDKFWNMQIAQLVVGKNGKVVMIPQVGDQKLEFGYAENFKSKFKRLEIFFKEIMPTKGWNTYSRVNVEYKDQLICD
ncbi:cell division protein FtsQ [uncultured Roseivirga sp.]|uniref:cell division protein FtsQ/DivIB n=1 Tax=uncultured Roseivirga sp. TaxID=543088 RepID=UPI0030DA8B81|tara:strand:+ start:5469 stop:6236 length:768 start_codon:yes stop_codon:yes gene_type:complete